MADDTAHAVVNEADAAAQPAAEAGNDAPDVNELDALLKQYDESVTPAQSNNSSNNNTPASEQKPDDLNDRIRAVVEHQERDIAERRATAVKQAIDDAAKAVKGDLPDSVASVNIARGWLKDAADNDKRIQKAFSERETNPDGWNKVLAGLSKAFAKEVRRPDQTATEDREAVTAAVRGASSNAPAAKEPDIKRMTDTELRKYQQEKFGYTPHF